VPPPPHFRVETSLNAALPSIALLYGRNLMDTLHERVGDEEDIRGAKGLHQDGPNTGGWARVIGTGGKQQGDPLGIFGSGPQYSYGFLGLQGGQDFIRHEHDDGSRDHVGATFAVGSAHGDVTHFDGTKGDDDLQAYTLGGYWTHFGVPGWYVDTMLQGTLYDVRTTANRGLLPFRTKGDGIAGSVEGGYPFRFAGGYFIEPQAQVIYQRITFNDASDNEALVRFSNVESLIGRIGARFGRTWSLDDDMRGGDARGGRLITVWVRPNVWQEFLGNPITQFSSETGFIPFRADLGGTWGEINVGVSGQVNLNTTLFANTSYQERFDGKGYAYNGKAGARINW
jgi:outer membrane autotransporter protein